jgi:membrane protease YdiL (CAAX protease family)
LFATIAGFIVALAVAYGMSWWARRADRDRSASMGLYLVIGIPATLLLVAGAATAVRKLLAKVTPIDPASMTDMVGLSVVFAFIAVTAATFLDRPEPPDEIGSLDYAALIAQGLFLIALAYIVVGFGNYRNARQATERLGVRRISVVGIVVAVSSVIAMLFLNGTAGLLMQEFQPELIDDLEDVTNEMTADVQSVPGAVAVGLSAGIGEELLMRGALQPRFGIVITSLFFTALHTQYGLTFVLLGLFGMSLILGWLRNRYGTIAPIIAHAIYNMIAVLIQVTT